MRFTLRELQAMARLSPARRRAIYQEVYREASRTAYVTADQEVGLEDAGMGKSLRKRLKKAVKKVTAPIKRVVDKVQDTVKRVTDNVEETVKRVAVKIPGAKAASNVGRRIQKVAKRAGGAVQRVAKEVARKAAPLIAIAMPLSLGVKSIRKNTAKFYRKYGPLLVSAFGTVLAPFTFGLSAVAAALIVKGRELYLVRNAAIKAKAAGKAEAAQMGAAVQEQEAALHAQSDEVYNHPDSHESFLVIGLTPERWAALSVDVKMGIIDSLAKGEIPPGYSLTPEAQAAAEEVRRKAQNDELDDLYVKYQAAFEASGIPSDRWYAMSIEEKYAVIDGFSDASQEVTGGETPPSSTPSTTTQSTPSVTSPSPGWANVPGIKDVPMATTGEIKYQLVIEGNLVGTYASPGEAAKAGASKASKGDRVEVLGPDGTSLGLAIKTDAGLVPVPEDQVPSVQALSHGEIVSKVSQATQTVKESAAPGEPKKAGGFPWLLLAVPAVLFVGAKAKGA